MSAKKKIFLIDNNKPHFDQIELILEKEYEIYKTDTGKNAVQNLYKHDFSPDLILLDIVFPKIEGWDVFKFISAMSLLKDIPIAFFASTDEKIDYSQAYKTGITNYIIFPCSEEELKERIKGIMEKRK